MGLGVAHVFLSGTIGNTVNKPPRIVIDTNVLVSALKSRNGWSFHLLAKIGKGMFEHVVTVPLLIEYEDVLHRKGMVPISRAAVDDMLDYVCASGLRHKVHFLWRPKPPMATSNSPTCGHPNSSRQDGPIIDV